MSWLHINEPCSYLTCTASGGVINTCNYRTREAETQGLKMKDLSPSHGKFETSLGYMRPFLKDPVSKRIKYVDWRKSLEKKRFIFLGTEGIQGALVRQCCEPGLGERVGMKLAELGAQVRTWWRWLWASSMGLVQRKDGGGDAAVPVGAESEWACMAG